MIMTVLAIRPVLVLLFAVVVLLFVVVLLLFVVGGDDDSIRSPSPSIPLRCKSRGRLQTPSAAAKSDSPPRGRTMT